MSKFKVGDLVRANEKNTYNITNYNMKKAEVIDIDNDECMEIKILDHLDKTQIGEIYYVNVDGFDLYEMSLSALQFGDILTLRNEERYVVSDGYMYGEDKNYYCDCDEIKNWYEENLIRKIREQKECDIIKVERFGQVIYEREEEIKEMTLEQVCKELGYEVKIVKEEE